MVFAKNKTSKIFTIISFPVTNPPAFDWKTNCECNPESQSSDGDGNISEIEAGSHSLLVLPTKGRVNLNFIALNPQGNIKSSLLLPQRRGTGVLFGFFHITLCSLICVFTHF